MPTTNKTRYFWVYVPEHDEAGAVVEATDFDDAFNKGCEHLCPAKGDEVQIHELGESTSFVYDGEDDDA